MVIGPLARKTLTFTSPLDLAMKVVLSLGCFGGVRRRRISPSELTIPSSPSCPQQRVKANWARAGEHKVEEYEAIKDREVAPVYVREEAFWGMNHVLAS